MKTSVKIIFVLSAIFCAACGVKGRPLPPEKPAELGRGKPTFTRSSEDFRFRNIPPVETEADATVEEDKPQENNR